MTSFPVMPTNRIVLTGPNIGLYQCSECDMWDSFQQNFTMVSPLGLTQLAVVSSPATDLPSFSLLEAKMGDWE